MSTTNSTRKISIRTRILVPVLILGILGLFTSAALITGIRKVNRSASTIADVYMAGTQELGEIQKEIQDLHTMGLSHIVATDFTTMIQIADLFKTQEVSVHDRIDAYEKYISESSKKDYDSLKQDYDGFTDTIRQLLAYSANTSTTEAYQLANNELAEFSTRIEEEISNINAANAKATQTEREDLAKLYTAFVLLSTVTIIVSIVAIILAIFIVMKQVVHPISKAEKELETIIRDIDNRQGDLTKRIPVYYQDEVGALCEGINAFMEKLQHIFKIISTNSEKMDVVVSDVLSSVRTSNDSASDLSALTEELLATMQEVANNASAINGNADAVRSDVNVIAERTAEITQYSKTMKNNADQMESDARNNVMTIGTKVNDILEVLGKAIQDSKSVEQVNSLTDEILNISSQTNLLALNASIEAARAGEAGKGFAVVADEIRNLADSSRDTANNIQEINSIVVSAVRNLSENSENLVHFMRDSILPEFENFVESGAQYKNDATYVEEVMNDFLGRTEELNNVVIETAESINTITAAIEEGVRGVNGAADSTQVLVTDMDDITRRMNENSEIAGDLKEETSVFARL